MSDIPPPPPSPDARPLPPPSPEASPAGANSEPASFGARLGAHIIDHIIFGVIVGVGIVCGSIVGGDPAAEVGLGLGYFLGVVAMIWYYAEFEGVRGQTIGKKAFNIRTVRKGMQEPIGKGCAVGRVLAKYYISIVYALLGCLWMLWDADKQTWHDKLVDSEVVRA